MDYGKSGNPKSAKGAPKFDDGNKKLSGKDARGGKADKAELLARMKAAQDKRAAD
ncbi:hypothetical protein GGQ68_004530 [Sagittula marina]|uniref:Uncharacterized protein n=1 Tax=Sagittula marina TaxID=943940 RepID=A0A7W6GW85_9RHOB|nr:hypothetical protein [Sagittula marina]MBB3988174.1 hypothetical protein [Sagittula marina]